MLLKVLLIALFIEISVQQSRLVQLCPALKREPWSYAGLNGPMFWGENYPQCYGEEQSPISIMPSNAVTDENLGKLSLENYDQPLTKATIENNGHAIEVVPEDGIERTISVNGVTYTLQQFHFHWGKVSSRGSEHIIDGKQYTMEMHFVFTNGNGEIAVVGVLFQQQDKNNAELQKIVDALPEVLYKGSEAQLDSDINLNNLLPANPTSYYRYSGSLTTPPCTQNVIWSVLPDPIPVGKSQMEAFRRVYATEKRSSLPTCKLSGNYRPVQPLNDRQVYRSQ